MGLKTVKFNDVKITFTGGDISVRGLSLDDIMVLYSRNADLMSVVFDKFSNGELKAMSGVSEEKAMALALIQTCPEIVAEAIALVDGDFGPDTIAMAKKLPLSVQIEAIQRIGTLTFESLGGPKNTLAAVIQMFNGMTTTLSSLSD